MHLRNIKIQNIQSHKQKGVVLVVGLIMVLLITIVGLSAVRSSGLQESMAGNMRDRNIAFQAAESALRSGEEKVAPTVLSPGPFDGTEGLHMDLNKNPADSVWFFTKEDWENTDGSNTNNVFIIDTTSSVWEKFAGSKLAYLVEELEVDVSSGAAAEGSAIDVGGMQTTGDATPYRISSRGVGPSTDTEIILQSTYKRRFQ